jgi:hypothetical protein
MVVTTHARSSPLPRAAATHRKFLALATRSSRLPCDLLVALHDGMGGWLTSPHLIVPLRPSVLSFVGSRNLRPVGPHAADLVRARRRPPRELTHHFSRRGTRRASAPRLLMLHLPEGTSPLVGMDPDTNSDVIF